MGTVTANESQLFSPPFPWKERGEDKGKRVVEDDAAAMEAGFTAIKKRPQGVSVSHSLSLLLWCVV